jgi:hypothetical protein
MGSVLAVGAIIKCSHGGSLKLAQGSSKLSVGGNAVVTAGMESGLSFAVGSPNVVTPCPKLGPGPAFPPSPCASTGSSLPPGVAVKLLVDGKGVLLDSASGLATNPNDPAATWSVTSAGQTLLEAV